MNTRRLLTVVLLVVAISGCGSNSSKNDAEAVKKITPVSFNAANLQTVEFNAPDMMCPEGCGVKVKEILSEQPGAKDVLVDFDAKKAIVAVDGNGTFDANAAVAALVDHGFKNSSVNGDSETAEHSSASPTP